MSSTAKKTLIAVTAIAIAVGFWRWTRSSNDRSPSEDAAVDGDSSATSTPSGGIVDEMSLLDRARAAMRTRESGELRAVDLGGRGVVVGEVLDTGTGARVEGTDVLFRHAGGESTATSNGSGEFEIELAAGVYQVQAIGDRIIGMPQPSLRVVRSDQPLKIEVRVTRLASLRGVVRNHAGLGVDGAAVRFVARTPNERAMAKTGLLLTQVSSQGGGLFELDVIGQKQVILEAQKGHLVGRVAVSDIEPGSERSGIEISLQKGVNVGGSVVDPGGRPVAGATVSLHVGSEGAISHTQSLDTDRKGEFQFEPMTPGTVTIEARARGFAATVPLRDTFAAGRSARVVLRLQAPEVLSGRVVDGEGAPIANARIRAGRANSKLRFDEVTNDSGDFALEAVDAGYYWISASKGSFATSTAEQIKSPADDVEIVLHRHGGIRGVVVGPDGKPLPHFVVEVVTKKRKGESQPRPIGEATRFDEPSGTYQLDELDPGSYQLSIRAGSLTPVNLTVEVPPGEIGDGSATLLPSVR